MNFPMILYSKEYIEEYLIKNYNGKNLKELSKMLENIYKKKRRIFEAYEDDIITREIDSIKLKINHSLVDYISKEEGVSIKDVPSSFMLRNVWVSTLNLDIAI